MGEESALVFSKHPRTKRLISNQFFWGDLIKIRARAEKAFSGDLQKIVDTIDRYVQAGADQDDDPCRQEVDVYQSGIRRQLGRSIDDGYLYNQCVKEIEKLDGKCEAVVMKFHKTRFRNLISEFQLQKILIDLRRKKYLRRCADIEKEEIKALFSTEKIKLQAKLDGMKTKTVKSKKKYEKALADGVTLIQDIKRASTRYENAWKKMEGNRCEAVMGVVAKSAEESNAWKLYSRDISCTNTDLSQLLEEGVVRLRIDIPTFQKYEETVDKEALLSQLLKEGSITNDTGDHLQQILPANADGYAYGICKKGNCSKSKKGFYPAAHVRVLEGD